MCKRKRTQCVTYSRKKLLCKLEKGKYKTKTFMALIVE